MVVRPRLRRVLAALGLYLGAAVGVAYFAFHGWHGAHGLQARRAFEAEWGRLLIERDGLQAARAEMDKRVALLRPQGIDPDLLDERARDLLNWSHPNDLVILVERPKP